MAIMVVVMVVVVVVMMPLSAARRGLQLAGHAPTFSRQHPDANPGARPNADINLGKKVLRGGQHTSTAPRSWELQRSWPSERAHAVTSAAVGLMSTEIYGQVTGIDVDSRGRIWVLQRTPERKWDASAFTMQHKIRHKDPIRGNTIVRYPSEDSTEIDLAAGANVFQMPHMLTVDGPGNVWVVDCGLHQVLKYAAGSNGEVDFTQRPVLEIGVKLEPGSDNRHLCKPTDVAIKADGGFFVSDGYCNSRVISFDSRGKIVKQWGSFGRKAGEFNLPHALAWDEDRKELFVADRMNSRVQVFSEQGMFLREYGGRSKGWGLTFGLALAAPRPGAGAGDGGTKLLYVSTVNPSAIFVLESASGRPVGSFDTPRGGKSALMPHDVGVTLSGTVFVGESKLNALYKYKAVL